MYDSSPPSSIQNDSCYHMRWEGEKAAFQVFFYTLAPPRPSLQLSRQPRMGGECKLMTHTCFKSTFRRDGGGGPRFLAVGRFVLGR